MLKPLHQGISVSKMEDAVQWYNTMLGFHLCSDTVEPALNCRVVFMEREGFQLELFQYLGEDGRWLPPERREPNEDLKTCGTKHVAYQVDDLDQLLEHLKHHGADIAMDPFQMGMQKICFIRDNTGVLIELVQL